MKRNLIVVAHPDDEILGFGATGLKLVQGGELVQAVILCGNADARTHRPEDEELLEDMLSANRLLGFADPISGAFPNIKTNTVPHLELVQFIEQQILEFQPHRIFTHHPGDLNDDHLQVSRACMAASRLFQRRCDLPPLEALCTMEILSSTDWAFPSAGQVFLPNLFVEVTDQLESKIQALSCYRKVMRDFPHPRSKEILTGLAAYRGGQAGQKYSESFQTVFRREM
jgi:LmbE family N-acetylglucosaminyl deacetylase